MLQLRELIKVSSRRPDKIIHSSDLVDTTGKIPIGEDSKWRRGFYADVLAWVDVAIQNNEITPKHFSAIRKFRAYVTSKKFRYKKLVEPQDVIMVEEFLDTVTKR